MHLLTGHSLVHQFSSWSWDPKLDAMSEVASYAY